MYKITLPAIIFTFFLIYGITNADDSLNENMILSLISEHDRFLQDGNTVELMKLLGKDFSLTVIDKSGSSIIIKRKDLGEIVEHVNEMKNYKRIRSNQVVKFVSEKIAVYSSILQEKFYLNNSSKSYFSFEIYRVEIRSGNPKITEVYSHERLK